MFFFDRFAILINRFSGFVCDDSVIEMITGRTTKLSISVKSGSFSIKAGPYPIW